MVDLVRIFQVFKDPYRERLRRLLVTLRRPRALTISISNYNSRRNNFLKSFNKEEDPFKPDLL